MWTVTHSAETTLSAGAIWATWADVGRWPHWNPDISSVELHGPFAAGSSISMTPIGGPEAVQLRIVDAVENERFVDEASLGDTTIRTAHQIEPIDGERVRIVYKLEATGPEASQLGPAISADFPETIAGLVEYAVANVPA